MKWYAMGVSHGIVGFVDCVAVCVVGLNNACK